MRAEADIKAASLWLWYRRNPDATRAQARAAFGWPESTCTRHHENMHYPSPRLSKWLGAIKWGAIPMNHNYGKEKIWWFNQIQDMMMIGTPPWGPDDYIDVAPDLSIVEPRGATIQEERPHEYRVSFPKEVLDG